MGSNPYDKGRTKGGLGNLALKYTSLLCNLILCANTWHAVKSASSTVHMGFGKIQSKLVSKSVVAVDNSSDALLTPKHVKCWNTNEEEVFY